MHVVLERIVLQIAEELRELDRETVQLHPGGHAHQWSAHEVVGHLVLGYRKTATALQTRLNKGRTSRNQNRTWLQLCLQWMILSLGNLPRGVPALDETIPKPDSFAPMNGQQLGALLRQEMETLDTILDACWREFGVERVATHPWLGPLRVDQWRRFHAIHGEHHLVQIRAVIAQVAPAPVPIRIHSGSLVKERQVPSQRPLAQKNAV
jgi:hypothetical protein